MDSVQSKAHGAALDLMGANAGAPESLKALADTLAAQWEGAENVPAVVLVALGHVAIARGQVDADCQRWHAEAREATQARHALSEELSEARESLAERQRARDAAQARANNAETELRRVRLAMADQTARFNALYARHEELTAALATVARIIGKDSGNG